MAGISKEEFFSTLKRVRTVAGDMTVQRLQILTLISMADPEGISLTELTKRASVNQSNTSKMVHNMTKLTSAKKPGPGFVTAESDPMDLSTKIVRLTPRGREVVSMIFGEDGYA